MRILKRVIVKHFGSTKSFLLWLVAVIVTIYFIDSYILTRDRLESLVQGQGPKNPDENGKHMEQAVVVDDHIDKGVPPAADLPKPPEDLAKPAHDVKAEEKAPEKKPNQAEAPQTGKCGLKEPCEAGKFAYLLRTAVGRDGTPTMCFNGKYAMSPDLKNGARGLNIAVVNDKTGEVEEVRYFDTYADDAALIRFLKLAVTGNKMLMLATMDEASNGLKADSKKALNQFGSSVIDKLRFRDGMLMLGQHGLTHGSAIEKFSPRERHDFAPQIELTGCVGSPMGKLNEAVVVEGEKKAEAAEAKPAAGDPSALKLGEELSNCGVKDACGAESFSVHIFSGQGNSMGPKICVGGKYVLATGLNDGGRGFNIVIVDPKTKEVVRVGHFDTYQEDSSNLEIFLEMMNDGELVVAVTHDDASKSIQSHARKLFEELGSSMIHQMDFRDIWGFVGQKGINGHTPIEDLEQRLEGSSWPHPIDKRVCAPIKMKGTKIKPDPMANKNEKRRKFCAKYDGYGDFCESGHIDEALTPAPLADKSLENHEIFQVPIIVVPGLNHNAVRMQLETLMLNPGIKPEMVTVMIDEKFPEPAALAGLFNFKSSRLTSSTKYVFQVEKALQKVWELHPTAKYVIVLEEEVIVGPDFLYFLAQCLPAVASDDTLIGISGWNENGYEGLSGMTDLAYRTETFPGLGFLLKRSFYNAKMAKQMADCCRKRSWDGWMTGQLSGMEMIVPDTSRVYRRPYEGLSEQGDMLTELFNRARITNLETQPKLSNAAQLTSAVYEAHMQDLISKASPLDTANVEDCLEGKGLGFYVPKSTGKVYSIYFDERSADDTRVLSLLCHCFKLFYVKNYPPRGLHNNSIRFAYQGNTVFFIGSLSPYYKNMPATYKPVKKT